MYLSVNKLAEILGMDRRTIKNRLDSVGFEPKDGPKGAHLYHASEAISTVLFTLDDCSEANIMRAQIRKVIDDQILKLKLSASAKKQIVRLLEDALYESDQLCDGANEQIAHLNKYE